MSKLKIWQVKDNGSRHIHNVMKTNDVDVRIKSVQFTKFIDMTSTHTFKYFIIHTTHVLLR